MRGIAVASPFVPQHTIRGGEIPTAALAVPTLPVSPVALAEPQHELARHPPLPRLHIPTEDSVHEAIV